MVTGHSKGRDALIDATRVTAIDEFVKVKGIMSIDSDRCDACDSLPRRLACKHWLPCAVDRLQEPLSPRLTGSFTHARAARITSDIFFLPAMRVCVWGGGR